MALISAPGQEVLYVVINKQTKQVVAEKFINTTQNPYPARTAKDFFAKQLADTNNVLFMKVGGQD